MLGLGSKSRPAGRGDAVHLCRRPPHLWDVLDGLAGNDTSNELSANVRLWAAHLNERAKGGLPGTDFCWRHAARRREKSQPSHKRQTWRAAVQNLRVHPPPPTTPPQAHFQIRSLQTSPIIRGQEIPLGESLFVFGAASKMLLVPGVVLLRRVIVFDRVVCGSDRG